MPTWYVKDRNGPHVIVSADHRFPGRYLKAYDPEAHDGRGQTEWTTDLADAVVYPDFVAAFEAWRQVPKTRPKREDGQPNRPLTGVSVMFDPVQVCSHRPAGHRRGRPAEPCLVLGGAPRRRR